MREDGSAARLAATIGERHGPSEWVLVDQARIDAFARATGDFQWIHVDPERAARELPGGRTIAHGYLTLSLVGALAAQVLGASGAHTLNAGCNRLRFVTPVPAGSRVRLFMTVLGSEPGTGGLKVTCEARVEIEGVERPALVAEVIFLYLD